MNLKKLNNLVKSGFLSKSQSEDLILYNYTKKCVYSKHWDKYTINSRGNVYDLNGKLIAKSFPKFFNFSELSTSKARLLMKKKNFEVLEKVDGSLGIIFNYNNKWKVNTRGSFNSDQTIEGQKILKQYDLSQIDKKYTILVEIIYPENRIVIDYGKERRLVLLTAYDVTTKKEVDSTTLLNIHSKTKIPVPKKFKFKTIEEVMNYQKNLSFKEEGVVVRFEDGYRVKFKSEEYLKIASLLAHLTPLDFWKQMKNGKIPIEIIIKTPEEFRERAENISCALERQYRNLYKEITTEYNSIISKFSKSENIKKNIALHADKVRHLPAMFSVFDNNMERLDHYITKRIRPTNNQFTKI